MGTLLDLREKYPQTQFWIDSIIDADIDFALKNGSWGITTAPSITAHAVRTEHGCWLSMAQRIHSQHPEYSERKLLWACMYEAAEEAAKKLFDIFNPDRFGMNGHLAMQANIYDFNNTEKIVNQAKKIHSLGQNFIIKIPATEAGLKAIEEVVASGHSVLATSCASVAQVVEAAEALMRGYDRHINSGGTDGGLCLSIAMQLAWQDMCVVNYAKQHKIELSKDAMQYAAISVAKKSYKILKERFPKVAFMLSNLKTDLQISEFIGGDILLTIPYATQLKVDGWDMPESRIDEAPPAGIVEELLDKIPYYSQSYLEDGMTKEQFSKYIPFCRIINDFIPPYEEAIRTMRAVIVPNLYGNDVPVSY